MPVVYGHLEIVEFLLEKGADVRACEDDTLRASIKNKHFQTTHMLALHYTESECLEVTNNTQA